MSRRFFESEKHVALYVQFRPIPPQKLSENIVNFLKEKVFLLFISRVYIF